MGEGGSTGSACTRAPGQWVEMPTAGAPTSTALRVEVWTGRELLIWTSQVDTWVGGGRFDPCANKWTPASVSGMPPQLATNRSQGIVVGRRIFFPYFGAFGNAAQSSSTASAAVYDIDGDNWQVLPLAGAPAPRDYAVQIAVGNKILIWGGQASASSTETLINDGGLLDATTLVWKPVSLNGAPAARQFASAAVVGDGQSVMIWGGGLAASDPVQCSTDLPCHYANTGAIYSAAADAWSTLDASSAPTPRRQARVAPTLDGRAVLAWGGFDSTGHTPNDGAMYLLTAGRWSPLPPFPPPATDFFSGSFMMGNRLAVFGATEAVLDPAVGTWVPVDATNKPAATGRSAILVGDPEQRILVALPDSTKSAAASLGRIAPTGSPAWQQAAFPDAGRPKLNGTFAWTGDALVVWGGYISVPDPNGRTGCENVPPGQPCDPIMPTKMVYDAMGAVWKPVWQ